MEMPFMALQAEEWLVLDQHVVGDRTMGVVADGAVVLNRSVAEYERTLVAAMAVEAQVVGALGGVQFAVRVVAVAAAHLALFDWMVRGEVALGHLLLVAAVAEVGVFLFEHSGFGVFIVHAVAVGAAEIGQGVFAVGPVHQVAVGVAGGADGTGFFGGQFGGTQNSFLVAHPFDMQAAGAVAGFAALLSAHHFKVSQTSVNVVAEVFRHVAMAIETGILSDIAGTFNLRHGQHLFPDGARGTCGQDQQQGKQADQSAGIGAG